MRNIFKFTAADLATPQTVHFVPGGDTTTIALLDGTDITGGGVTLEFAQKDSKVFESPADDTINLAAPSSITITESCLGSMRVTLSSPLVGVDEFSLVVNTCA